MKTATIICLLLFWTGAAAMADTFEIGEKDFLYNGKPFVIRAGEIHAARIPPEYWRHRLQMVRAMGCNTVCAYFFWNLHEPVRGHFSFSDNADMAQYVRIAQQEGLKVILRPGPYSCAEWDLGGFPWWLLKDPNMQLRTRYPEYLKAVRNYLLEAGKQLSSLQITRGGPIIMVQVENEYGTYGNDKEYIGTIRDYLVEAGFDVPFFTCDGLSQLKNDVREDIFCVVNFGKDPEKAMEALRTIRPKGPLMCGEYYPGWFDHWGKPHHYGDGEKIISDLTYMLDRRISFSLYMVHGGTNFGFWAGANCPPFAPQTTSYDYDAPISEAGWATEKYHTLRSLFRKYLQPGETLPDIPPSSPVIEIPSFTLTETAELLRQLPEPRIDVLPQPMEMYGQSGGVILYRTKLPPGKPSVLHIKDVHDRALVFLNQQPIGTIDRRVDKNTVDLPELSDEAILDILVEAMGRVNFGKDIHDRKGITQSVSLSTDGPSILLQNWLIYNLPLDNNYLIHLVFSKNLRPHHPAFYRGMFHVSCPGDTFLDMRQWKKGLVWVNGRNLGRFWRIGPQQTLYLPGCWLQKGENQILVLDFDGPLSPDIQGLQKPILDICPPD